MKQTVKMDRIQAAMRPGVITLDGFLGADGRKLVDILDYDDARVKRLGLTHEAIALRMNEFRNAGFRAQGRPMSVAPHFEVSVESVRGKLPCPFGHAGLVSKTNTIVRNLSAGDEITYTDLNTHMIGVHGFYQGRGAAFRLEPEELARVLEIALPEEVSQQDHLMGGEGDTAS